MVAAGRRKGRRGRSGGRCDEAGWHPNAFGSGSRAHPGVPPPAEQFWHPPGTPGICSGLPWVEGKAASSAGQGTMSCPCVQPNGGWQSKGFGGAVGWWRPGGRERSVPPWQRRAHPPAPARTATSPSPCSRSENCKISLFFFPIPVAGGGQTRSLRPSAVLEGTVGACNPPGLASWGAASPKRPMAVAPKHHGQSLQPNRGKHTLFLTGQQSGVRGRGQQFGDVQLLQQDPEGTVGTWRGKWEWRGGGRGGSNAPHFLRER